MLGETNEHNCNGFFMSIKNIQMSYHFCAITVFSGAYGAPDYRGQYQKLNASCFYSYI